MKTLTAITSFALLLLGAGQVQAGYWFSGAGEVVRSGAGECWHTGYWSLDAAIVGCDGKVADVAAPEAEPPAAPPPPTPVGSVDAKVNFGFDRADLDADAMAAIDTLVSDARSKGTISGARLTGHADRIGTEGYNMDLSLRRASSVSDYLTQRAGVDPQTVDIGGRGESEPLVACEGERGAAAIRCLAPNRRVDVIIDLAP